MDRRIKIHLKLSSKIMNWHKIGSQYSHLWLRLHGRVPPQIFLVQNDSCLGALQLSSRSDRVDNIKFELNNEKVDEFPSPKKGEAWPPLKQFPIQPSWIKRISMMGVCRYQNDGVYLSMILNKILNGKFDNVTHLIVT